MDKEKKSLFLSKNCKCDIYFQYPEPQWLLFHQDGPLFMTQFRTCYQYLLGKDYLQTSNGHFSHGRA